MHQCQLIAERDSLVLIGNSFLCENKQARVHIISVRARVNRLRAKTKGASHQFSDTKYINPMDSRAN